jgi:hypothetical protein
MDFAEIASARYHFVVAHDHRAEQIIAAPGLIAPNA